MSSSNTEVAEVTATTNSTSTSNDDVPRKITTMSEYEKRMEVNRIRAKQIRKRKKKMEEDMRQQIVQLTLENNRLRIQKKMQDVELERLRKEQYNQQNAMMMFQQQGAAGLNPNIMLGAPHSGLNTFGLSSANDTSYMHGGVEAALRQQMLASLAAGGGGGNGGDNEGTPNGGATAYAGAPLPQTMHNSLNLSNASSDQVEAALRYDQALLSQLNSMQGGTGAARMIAMQNQQIGAARGAAQDVGEVDGSGFSDNQNKPIMNLLSDRSLTVQECILKELQEQSNGSTK